MSNRDSYQENKIKSYFLRTLEEKFVFIVGVPLLAVLITAFIFHFYRVDGMSMERTFQNNDLLIVEKIGKTVSSISRNNYVPKRYETIVFKQPLFGDGEELVKRVIGLPGDRVVIRDDEIIVYNKADPEGIKVNEHLPPEAEIINGRSYADSNTKVKAGEVFVLGDNRPNSEDSRFFGPIKSDNIIGKVIVRILPFNNLLIL